jgi:hypothetical protein
VQSDPRSEKNDFRCLEPLRLWDPRAATIYREEKQPFKIYITGHKALKSNPVAFNGILLDKRH